MNANETDFARSAQDIESGLTTPDVSLIVIEADRRAKLQAITYRSGLALVAVALLGGLWFTSLRPAELEVAGVPNEEQQVDNPTTTEPPTMTVEELDVASPTNDLRDLFISTRTWTPIARTGIPETGSFAEHVRFFGSRDSDSLALQSCLIVPPYLIDWEPDGFTVTGVDLEAELDARGCGEPGQEGIAATPIQTGEKVAVTSNNDGSYTLTGSAWSLTITGEAPSQPSTTEAPETTTTTTVSTTTVGVPETLEGQTWSTGESTDPASQSLSFRTLENPSDWLTIWSGECANVTVFLNWDVDTATVIENPEAASLPPSLDRLCPPATGSLADLPPQVGERLWFRLDSDDHLVLSLLDGEKTEWSFVLRSESSS